MRISFLLFLITYFSATMQAQQAPGAAGEYFLRGVMETASVIQLKTDSTFEFFFSQGALDRYGSGSWSLKNNTIVMNSQQRPPKDFALINSKKKVPEDSITIRMVEKNTMLLGYVQCAITTSKGESRQQTDSEGFARFEKGDLKSISLIFELCPDRYSVFPIEDKSLNYFEFRFEKWIAEIFFENFTLKVDNGRLTGGHPLLEKKRYTYERD